MHVQSYMMVLEAWKIKYFEINRITNHNLAADSLGSTDMDVCP